MPYHLVLYLLKYYEATVTISSAKIYFTTPSLVTVSL
nr:MAG TPA: hypothetical protein [Caudoviricetes sp.]